MGYGSLLVEPECLPCVGLIVIHSDRSFVVLSPSPIWLAKDVDNSFACFYVLVKMYI